MIKLKELFEELDPEDDGAVYLKQVVVTLKALNQDIDANLQVIMEKMINSVSSDSKFYSGKYRQIMYVAM